MRPIPAPRLGDAHGLLRVLARRGRVRVDELLVDDAVEELFPPGLENALGRTRQFTSFARAAGLLTEDRGTVELTDMGRRYVRAADPGRPWDVATAQAEWLRRLLRERHMTDSIYHGAAIGLSVCAAGAADVPLSTLDFGRALSHLGRTGWDNENTLASQGERYTTFLRDLGVIDGERRLTPTGDETRAELTLPPHPSAAELATALNPGGLDAARAEGEAERRAAAAEATVPAAAEDGFYDAAPAGAEPAPPPAAMPAASVPGLPPTDAAADWPEKAAPDEPPVASPPDAAAAPADAPRAPGGAPPGGAAPAWHDIAAATPPPPHDIAAAAPPAAHDIAAAAPPGTAPPPLSAPGVQPAPGVPWAGSPEPPFAPGGQARWPSGAIAPPAGPPPFLAAPPRPRRTPAAMPSADAIREAAEERELWLPAGAYATVAAALATGRHLLLTGPPGAGKTALALAVAEAAAAGGASDGTVVVTAGRRGPAAGATDVVLAAARAGHWVVVDELDRARADQVLGALSSFLAGVPVVLAGEHAVPPEDWRLVATAARIPRASGALLRRFAVVEVPPPGAEDLDAALRAAAGGDRTAVAAVQRLLPARDLGPVGIGAFVDAARYAAARAAGTRGEPVDEETLAREALAAFVAPLLPGLDEDGRRRLAALAG